jgi:hypothetical protein
MIREAGSPDRLPHIEVWKRRNRTFGCFRLFACLPECRSLGESGPHHVISPRPLLAEHRRIQAMLDSDRRLGNQSGG